MAIELQCEHCEQLIRVEDELGGQMGKCPHCGHSMYIPLPAGMDSEALELEQIDPEDEARRKQVMAKTRQTMHDLLQDRAEPEADENRDTDYKGPAKGKVKPIDPEDAAMTVEEYVVAMAHGSLEEAEALAVHLVGNPQVVKPVIAEAMERGLEHRSLRDVPAAVQKGLLRKLVEYLNN